MFPLLLFLAVTAPHPCDAGIVPPSRPLTINGQPAVCVQYVTAVVGDASVVVYAIEGVDRPRSSDFPHQAFVAFGKRRGDNAWKLSDRHDVTAALLSSEDIGNFILLDARVDRFTLAGARFVDAGVSTTLSGTGGISATKDLTGAFVCLGSSSVFAEQKSRCKVEQQDHLGKNEGEIRHSLVNKQ